MLTKIDLCSFALLKLGESSIQSLDDDSVSAQLSRTLFYPVVETLIALHPWRFAKKKINLNKTTDGDFLIPSEVIRILKSSGEVIGDRIISQTDSVSVTALIRVPVEKFPSYFASLVATKLAMEFCIPLSGDQNVFQMLVALYESELRAAKFIDSTVSVNSDIAEFSLISSRF